MKKTNKINLIKKTTLLVICLILMLSSVKAESIKTLFDPLDIPLHTIEFYPTKIVCPSGARTINLYYLHNPGAENNQVFSPHVPLADAYEIALTEFAGRSEYTIEQIEKMRTVYSCDESEEVNKLAYFQFSFYPAELDEIVTFLVDAGNGKILRVIIDYETSFLYE